eukprot:CAMPEP_0206140042 /NCGR_PEP_ID=MMETSP1473-20131121/8128_1 /ASSEMBLY_ACC=CAM_ASM_001109 /TAXON_ID=1461547 /ORGANISM="Stichococcus sp, Strain RCC1054" /LENGTH=154 /DNA_ID=CAMNT_0053534029 /DNA_START=273 /DNA_END=738 /DNA_ORIENTATION=+
MAAGMHAAGKPADVLDIVGFLDGESIDVGAEGHSWGPGSQSGNNARARNACPERDVQRFELPLEICRCAGLVKCQLWHFVQLPAVLLQPQEQAAASATRPAVVNAASTACAGVTVRAASATHAVVTKRMRLDVTMVGPFVPGRCEIWDFRAVAV